MVQSSEERKIFHKCKNANLTAVKQHAALLEKQEVNWVYSLQITSSLQHNPQGTNTHWHNVAH